MLITYIINKKRQYCSSIHCQCHLRLDRSTSSIWFLLKKYACILRT